MNQDSNDNSIKTYEGVAECTMNDADTIKNVKIRANDLAQENLLKKIADYVDKFLRDRLLIFPKNEILSVANEIYHITDVKYNVFDSDDNLMIRATVTAQVDDNDIMNCLIGFFQERTELKSQNESFRKEIEDLKSQIAELPNKIFLSYQKYEEANKLLNKKRYEGSIKLYDEVIELNPNFAEAYCNQGIAYFNLTQYERAIQDFNKAIELNPNFAEAYINRGKAYKKLGDKAKSETDFKKYDKLIKKS
ncbi:MAG: tetratricopeptide repeat protein [Selenomonadaceae bacterium]|nr:tetratricopeptide repeat protein [Selenomonadaceae bacterium]